MCVSSEALAILTLPNGDSKTHRPMPDGKDRQIASAGGCIDLLPSMELTVYQSYHNTSLVVVTEEGQVLSTVYRAPNIDLQPALAVPPGVSSPRNVEPLPVEDQGGYVVEQRFALVGGQGTIELLQDRRISPSVFSELWRAGDSRAFDAQHPQSANRPLLTAQLRLVFDSKLQVETRDIGYPLATLSSLDETGQAFTLRIDKTGKQASRIAEETLVPATHGLAPLH